MSRVRVALLISLVLFSSGFPIAADPLTLTSRNSTVSLDPHSERGVYSWIIDGEEVMFQQWFWLRAGESTREVSIDDSNFQITSHALTAQNRALVEYAGPEYDIRMKFALSGGIPGSKVSRLQEVITVTNNGVVPLPVAFFQYSNIRFSQGKDTVTFVQDNTVRQTGASAMSFFLDETIVNLDSLTHHEANLYPYTLNSLNDDGITTLRDTSTATGNVSWAFEWDKILGPGETLAISKDLNISDPPPLNAVPEPLSFVLLATCLGLYGGFKRRAGRYRDVHR